MRLLLVGLIISTFSFIGFSDDRIAPPANSPPSPEAKPGQPVGNVKRDLARKRHKKKHRRRHKRHH